MARTRKTGSTTRSGRSKQLPPRQARTTRRMTAGGATSFHFKHDKVKRVSGSTGRVRRALTTPGAAAAFEDYICRDGAVEFADGEPLVVSSISDDIGERRAFWRKAEETEREGGLVQGRIIAELPHELDAAQRLWALRRFAEVFAERGLRFTIVGHVPGPQSDERNFHLHAAYYKRPAERLADGRWDFEDKRTRQNADRATAKRTWIGWLREQYCKLVNAALELAGLVRRWFSGTYASMGLERPTETHRGLYAKGREIADRRFADGLEGLPEEQRRRLVIDRTMHHRRGVIARADETLADLDRVAELTHKQRALHTELVRRRADAQRDIEDCQEQLRAMARQAHAEQQARQRAVGTDAIYLLRRRDGDLAHLLAPTTRRAEAPSMPAKTRRRGHGRERQRGE